MSRDTPAPDGAHCPHCGLAVNMNDSDIYPRHTTYWGDDGSVPRDCGGCNATFYVKEHVSRWWTSGRTSEEAEQL